MGKLCVSEMKGSIREHVEDQDQKKEIVSKM